MRILNFDIKNFRRLSSCRIELDKEKTVFVGANNSGKTSALDAIRFYLSGSTNLFSITDIPLSAYGIINRLGKVWANNHNITLESVENYAHLDVWFEVSENELQYCYKFIPSLEWTGGNIGVRVAVSMDWQRIREDYRVDLQQDESLDLVSFLELRLSNYLSLKYYTLDPQRISIINQNHLDLELLEENPLKGLMKLDVISAQRSFYDISDKPTSNKLSDQLASYYDTQFNPKMPSVNGMSDLYKVIKESENNLSNALQTRYQNVIDDLAAVNYPNIGSPNISIEATIPVKDAIANSQSIRYKLTDIEHSLPENSNGLGMQNLVSISFRLMQFRDNWIKKENQQESILPEIEPIHLVLIEEPEAHLHPQSQIVFIRNAYEILRKADRAKLFTSQLVVTTHSSHIAYEVEYKNIRYFKRDNSIGIPTSSIISLSGTFDKIEEDKTKIEKFVKRYLKLFHADIFFADGIVLIEGAAEKILIPAFIDNNIKELSSKYLSIIEIGGSHAHRLLPLLERIQIPTLIIADIDPVEDKKKVDKPELGKGYKTSNPSIKRITNKDDFDELISLQSKDKTKENLHIVYQLPKYNEGGGVQKLFYTFEDALVEANDKLEYNRCNAVVKNVFTACLVDNNPKEGLQKLNKAEFATELLYEFSDDIITPDYILQGLKWLNAQL